MAFLTGRALIEGELSFATSAAARYMGVGSLAIEGNKLKPVKNGSYGPYVRAMLRPALEAGRVGDAEVDRMVGTAYAEGAERCLEKAGVRTMTDYYDPILFSCRSQLKTALSYGYESRGPRTQMVLQTQRANAAAAAADEARERQAARNRASSSRSYEPATSVGRASPYTAPPGAISSAEASRRAKANMCSGSLGSTSFCQ